MDRVTITEIAARSGVSKSAVSYALNGRPGLSEPTRQRILSVARDLGWTPNRTARLLSGSRTEAFGLVLSRPAETLGSEPFFMQLLAGLESELAARSYALLLQLAGGLDEELETYRKWWGERRVDGVFLVDVRVDDPRVALLTELELPALVVADPSLAGPLPCVWSDDATAMAAAIDHLADLGHRRVARVAGLAEFGHVRIRDDAFGTAVAARGLHGRLVHADFSTATGAAATAELLDRPDRPTAIVFDNDLMAVASLGLLAERGVDVPGQVSLLAWDDSHLCQLTRPKLSAMSHDVAAVGAAAARQLFAVIDGEPAGAVLASTPRLADRESTGPARP